MPLKHQDAKAEIKPYICVICVLCLYFGTPP